MNSFSINRFGQTFRWVLATNFRNFLAWTLGAGVGAFLMEMIFIALKIHPDGGNYVPLLYSSISQICQIALVIFVLVAFSTGFADYQKKPRREAFLMLPSTNLEKFLAVVIYVTVVWSLAGFLAFAVGDTLRMAVRALACGNEWYSLVPKVLEMFGEIVPTFDEGGMMIQTIPYKVCAPIFLVGLFVWIHSTYILGGTLLRKYAFVVSSLVVILAFLLMAWLIYKFNLNVFYVDTLIDGQSLEALRQAGALTDGEVPAESIQVLHKVGVLGYLFTVALPIISIFNYWASFHIFKGFQLITNKWTNYDILKR